MRHDRSPARSRERALRAEAARRNLAGAAAIKDPIPADGPCVFTGRAAVYFGDAEALDDGAGHVMQRDMPLEVCDKTAGRLQALGRDDLLVTPATWFYDGGGCC